MCCKIAESTRCKETQVSRTGSVYLYIVFKKSVCKIYNFGGVLLVLFIIQNESTVVFHTQMTTHRTSMLCRSMVLLSGVVGSMNAECKAMVDIYSECEWS